MKQLTIFEMEEIAGGYSWDFSSISNAMTSVVCNAAEAATSALLGGAIGVMIGSFVGGYYAGQAGGILGFGIIAIPIGAIAGTICGGVGMAAVAAISGWDKSINLALSLVDGVAEGTFAPWRA